MKALIILTLLLVGCSQVVYPRLTARIETSSATAVAGTCRFQTEGLAVGARWTGSGPSNVAWTAPCDSFEIGDTVWLEVRK